jgi:hypothetical protein
VRVTIHRPVQYKGGVAGGGGGWGGGGGGVSINRLMYPLFLRQLRENSQKFLGNAVKSISLQPSEGLKIYQTERSGSVRVMSLVQH